MYYKTDKGVTEKENLVNFPVPDNSLKKLLRRDNNIFHKLKLKNFDFILLEHNGKKYHVLAARALEVPYLYREDHFHEPYFSLDHKLPS